MATCRICNRDDADDSKDRVNWSYVAGFFDGEGSIFLRQNYKKATAKFPVIAFSNTNLEVLEKIRNFLNAGHINQKKENRRGYKKNYVLAVTDYKNSLRIAKELSSHCIVKRKALFDMISFLENYDYHSSNRDPYPSKDWLEEHYWGQKLSTYEIAKILNCSQQKVNNALHHHGIRLRTYREVVALRNPVRFKLLELLLDGRSRKYIHLLRAVGFESGKDAGRFAYHMKILLNADLLCKSGDNYIISQKGEKIMNLFREL